MTNNQQLAAHCRDVIANPQDHLDWVVDMARVALASLEAESRISLTVCRRAEFEHELTVYGRMPDGFYDLYTAPPMPELRPIVAPYLPDDCDRTEAHYKYAEAIRAAGYEVTS